MKFFVIIIAASVAFIIAIIVIVFYFYFYFYFYYLILSHLIVSYIINHSSFVSSFFISWSSSITSKKTNSNCSNLTLHRLHLKSLVIHHLLLLIPLLKTLNLLALLPRKHLMLNKMLINSLNEISPSVSWILIVLLKCIPLVLRRKKLWVHLFTVSIFKGMDLVLFLL